MDFSAIPLLAALLDGAHSLLTALAGLLETVAGPASAALAIVLVTLVVRGALVPLGVRQIRAEIARRRIAPAIAEIQRRYTNPETVQRKTLELYQKEGVSPLAGILPALAQIPVVSLLYGVAVSPTLNGHPNELLATTLGTAPLGTSFVALVGAGDWLSALVPAALLVVIGVTAWFTRRQTLAMATPSSTPGAATMLGVMSWMPFVSVVVSAFIPLAAVLYVATSTVWTFAERSILRRVLPGGAFHPDTARLQTA